MKTAEETINRIVLTGFYLPDAVSLIKDYAKQVALQALKDAAQNSTCEDISYDTVFQKWEVDKDSILNTEIELP